MTREQLEDLINKRIKSFPRYPLTASELRDVLFHMLDFLVTSNASTNFVIIKAEGNTSQSPEDGDWRMTVDANKTYTKEKRVSGSWVVVEEDFYA